MTGSTDEASRRMQEYDPDVVRRILVDRLIQDDRELEIGELTESEAVLFERAVERLFRNAPFVQAPPEFADRVMAAFELRTARESAVRARRRRLGWLRRWLLALVVLPLALLLFTIGPAPLALALLLRQAVWWLNDAAANLARALAGLAGYASGPLFAILMIGAVALTLAMWLSLMRVAGAGRQQVAYRIPVQFH